MADHRGRDAPGHFHRLAPGEYHKLSLAQKQGLVRGAEREPSVSCPGCGVTTVTADLLAHVETRCEGRRDPHPASTWISGRDAVAMGVPRETFFGWARRGEVRFLGERQDRKYLLRDVALRIAQRRANRRR